MRDLSTRAVLGRAALIGLVTGIIPTAIIWADMQEEELDGTALLPDMFLLAIILGTVGAQMARLPRWGMVGLVGGSATWLLIGALAVLVPVRLSLPRAPQTLSAAGTWPSISSP
ncbi:hypothetical protein [Nonomuraea turcica]|uniref:hypothetical protein n=1 Tax=Nonomuraea sp. G32 TaxID=3067274 RepID=UPI00273C28EE|nr:hypothetical protein [Nonomuraea sp. G32]MDP4505885.1 hypothetical protein [Nonomuraea sp. G32]